MPRPTRGHVLILEEDQSVCEFLARALDGIGIHVTVCRSPDAVEEIRQKEPPFNLVVTALSRPNSPPPKSVAYLRTLFPGVPILHLEEVIPFSVETFQEAARQRMRKEPKDR